MVNLVDGKWRLNTMGCILCFLTFYYSFLIVLMFSRKMRANLSENLRSTRKDVELDPEADSS